MVNVIEGIQGLPKGSENKNYIVAAKTGTAELISVEIEQFFENTLDDNLKDHALIIALDQCQTLHML